MLARLLLPTAPLHWAAAGLLAATLTLAGSDGASANPRKWVQDFWPNAKAAGVSRAVYDQALGNFTPDPDVLEKASRQAEFVKPLWEYLDGAVSQWRIENGQKMLAENRRLLDAIEARFGVDKHILVAIWGIESAYGTVFEDPARVKHTIRSLATLAYQGGSRAKYGRTQLVAALKILQRGDITEAGMYGSWAGAMGHTQFIPTTYEAYAVDFDGDGRRDIWNSPADALASAANYLKKSGWETGKTWGYEVRLADMFDYRHADEARAISAWQQLGVAKVSGSFPRPGDSATLLTPVGAGGPAFLMLKNFRVIKRYNNADSYAMAVGHLADRIRGGDPIVAGWPKDELPLTEDDRMELQKLLQQRGLYSASIDGQLGSGSRAAIRAYQSQAGLTIDGFASTKLLERLRQGL